MTAPVNGTDERLDVLIALVELLLAEKRAANASATAQNAGEQVLAELRAATPATPAKRARK